MTPSATTSDHTDRSADRDAVIAEWTVHLLLKDPRKGWGILAGVAAAATLGWMTFGGWVGGILGSALVLSAVAEFLLPIRYRLTSEHAACSYGLARLALPWSAVRRIIDNGDSIRLSPFRRPSRLDAFRGVEIRFGPAGSSCDRDAILVIVREMAGEADWPADAQQAVEVPHAR